MIAVNSANPLDRLNRLTARDRLIIFGVTVAARFLLLIWVVVAGIDPFRWSLDSWEYMATMGAIRDNNWGYFLFVSRTPGYPLLLRGFNILFGLNSPQMVAWLPFQAALTALSVDLKAGFMCCLLSRTLCDAAFVLRNDGDRAGLRDQVQLIQLPPSTFNVCAVM